jgi:hypothetical protein
MQHNKRMQTDLVPLMRGVQFAITPTNQHFWIPDKVVILVLYHKCNNPLIPSLYKIAY